MHATLSPLYRWQRPLMVGITILFMPLIFAQAARADPITLTTAHPYVGWFNSIGEHFANNANTFTGVFESLGVMTQSNSFYIWDVTPLGGIGAAAVTLRIRQSAFSSSDPSETIDIYDVSTDPADMLLNCTGLGNAAGMAIHNDLQTGNVYGSFVSVGPTNSQVHEVQLNAQAVADLNAAIPSGEFAIGLHLATASTRGITEGLKFGYDAGRIYELHITPIPEPSNVTLFGIGLLGLIGLAWMRRHQ